MAAVVTTNLPDDVQSLSDLIGIESTTQATLYVALRTSGLFTVTLNSRSGQRCNPHPSPLRILHHTVRFEAHPAPYPLLFLTTGT